MITIEKIVSNIWKTARENEDTKHLSSKKIMIVIRDYKNLRNYTKETCFDSITTYQELSCLFLSIITNGLSDNKKTNCEIAFDTCLNLCEKEIKDVDSTTLTKLKSVFISYISKLENCPTINGVLEYLLKAYTTTKKENTGKSKIKGIITQM